MTDLKKYRDQIAEEINEIIRTTVWQYKKKLRGNANLLVKVISTKLHNLGETNETTYLCKLRSDGVSVMVKARTTVPIPCKRCGGTGQRAYCGACEGAGVKIEKLNFQRVFPLGVAPPALPPTIFDEEFDFS